MVELSVLQQKFGALLVESFFRENRRIDAPAESLFNRFAR